MDQGVGVAGVPFPFTRKLSHRVASYSPTGTQLGCGRANTEGGSRQRTCALTNQDLVLQALLC
jgi:hypothetical protein